MCIYNVYFRSGDEPFIRLQSWLETNHAQNKKLEEELKQHEKQLIDMERSFTEDKVESTCT